MLDFKAKKQNLLLHNMSIAKEIRESQRKAKIQIQKEIDQKEQIRLKEEYKMK